MDWWTKIRLNVSRGEKSKRKVLREEGIHWETLKKKILKYSEPPGNRLKERRLSCRPTLFTRLLEPQP